MIYQENNSVTPPRKCGASARESRNALVALPYGLSHVAGLHADDAVSVTEPVTKIHSTISISSWPATARPGR